MCNKVLFKEDVKLFKMQFVSCPILNFKKEFKNALLINTN